MKKQTAILLVVSTLYILFSFLYINKFQCNISSTIELGKPFLNKLNGKIPSGLVIQKNSMGYDGQHFYLIAIDPLQQNVPSDSFRYQRILYPLLAHLTALGNISLIPWTLYLINLLSIIFGTYVLILILKEYQANLNYAYLYAFNVGFLVGIIRDLSEPLQFFLVLLSLFCLKKDKNKMSGLFICLALLTKETTLLILFPMLCYFLYKRTFKNFFVHCAAVFPFIIWQIFLLFMTGESHSDIWSSLIGLPFMGLIHFLKTVTMPNNYVEFYRLFSPLPVLIFAFILLIDTIKLKTHRLTLSSFVLLFNIFITLSLAPRLYYVQIDAMGRHAIPLFLFSVLFYAERKKKYNIFLIILITLMSLGHYNEKILNFWPNYFISP